MPDLTIATLARDRSALLMDLRSLDARCKALEAALTRIATIDETITYHVVGDTLHSCSSNGTVQRLVSRCIDRPGESGYEQVWESAPAVPGTVGAIVADALSELPRDGTAYESDDDTLERSA